MTKKVPLKLIFSAALVLAITLTFSCSSGGGGGGGDDSSSSGGGSSSSSSSSGDSSSSNPGELSSSSGGADGSSSSGGGDAGGSSSSEQSSASSPETPKCGGSEYDPETQGCCNGNKYDLKKLHYEKEKDQFCDERDGKAYVYVEIESQIWMAENLNIEAEGSKCGSVLTGSGTVGNDNSEACDTYGRLYNWATAMDNVCPLGWHLPSKVEWTTLTAVAVDANGLNPAAKLKANSLWSSGTSTDEYGFAALPGGFGNADGDFNNVRTYGYWWTTTENSTQATYMSMRNTNSSVPTTDTGNKNFFYSVRCVKN